MSPRIEAIQHAIKTMHECAAVHVTSVPVREMLGKQVVWEGIVEVFDLSGHPKAKRCYGWKVPSTDPDPNPSEVITVLELGPVEDASTAVRAAVMNQIRLDKKNHGPPVIAHLISATSHRKRLNRPLPPGQP